MPPSPTWYIEPADTGPPFLRLPAIPPAIAMAAITAPIPMAAAPPNEPIDATMAAGVHAAVVAAAEETLAAVVVAVPATAAEVVAAVAAICALLPVTAAFTHSMPICTNVFTTLFSTVLPMDCRASEADMLPVIIPVRAFDALFPNASKAADAACVARFC